MTRARLAALAAALLLPPLALRALRLIELDVAPGLPDLRGALADAALSLGVLVPGLWLASRRSAVALLCAGWATLHYANDEHLRALGALLGSSHAGFLLDPTFLRGSVLETTRPLLLGLLLAAALPLALWSAGRRASVGTIAGAAALAGLLLGAALALPRSLETSTWRQTHFALEEVRFRLERRAGGEAGRGLGPLVRVVPPDPMGELRFARPEGGRRPNVLLVILEGVSGLQLPSVASAHGRSPELAMPRLDAALDQALVFESFVIHQRQTNRGLFALLCGDYPGLLSSTPKMTLLGSGAYTIRCLPELLAEAGYATSYLQAAPLSFMLKGRFMRRIGFERVRGDAAIERAAGRSRWGVDDRSLFEAADRELERLGSLERPWFLTLLTVGTHHPFTLPGGSVGNAPDGRARAFAYLDHSVTRFLERFAERGGLRDTLVLVTSDESIGAQHDVDPLSRAQLHAFGFLGALGPELAPGPELAGERVRTAFAQLDVALSVLDYLDLDAVGSGLGGRSIFRLGDRPRVLAFGNTYLRGVGLFDPAERRLVFCNEGLRRCVAAPFGASMFAPLGRASGVSGPLPELERIALASVGDTSLGDVERYELLSEREVALPSAPHGHLVFAGQFVEVPELSRLEVRVDFEVVGERGRIRFVQDLATATEVVHREPSASAAAGERIRIAYTVHPRTGLEGLESRLSVFVDGPPVRLHFREATLTVVPGGGDASGRVVVLARKRE